MEKLFASRDARGGLVVLLDLWERHSRTLGVSNACALVPGGYSVELAVPWAHLDVRPAPNQVIGFDLSNNNDDDGGEREGQLVWSGSVANWTNNEVFMTANQLISGNPVRSATYHSWNDYIDETPGAGFDAYVWVKP